MYSRELRDLPSDVTRECVDFISNKFHFLKKKKERGEEEKEEASDKQLLNLERINGQDFSTCFLFLSFSMTGFYSLEYTEESDSFRAEWKIL